MRPLARSSSSIARQRARDFSASTAPLLLTASLFVETFIFLLTRSRNATLSAGITIRPLFAAENISHHCRTNICFSTGARSQFSARDCRWSIRWSTGTAIGKLSSLSSPPLPFLLPSLSFYLCARVTGAQKSS